MKISRKSSIRRLALGALALAAFAGPPAASGCAAGFASISQVEGLRVIGVVADKPYAQPGDEVTFTMTYADTFDRPPPTIAWIGGCFDPAGDEYYLCYQQLASVLQSIGAGQAPSGLVGIGPTFTLPLPADLISRRAKPTDGSSYYGIAYVLFAVCAGTLGPAPADGTSAAGSFPIGCFDSEGNRLGADSFVPGYTQVYAFSPTRTNENPVVTGIHVRGLDKDGAMTHCPVSEETRQSASGCGKSDPYKECDSYAIRVEVPTDVAEQDPASRAPDGTLRDETVWVDYFADKGDLDTPTALISNADVPAGADSGIQPAANYATNYIPPPDAGPVTLWAVVRDSRGGETVVKRVVQVR
jgi:hypothetical protein